MSFTRLVNTGAVLVVIITGWFIWASRNLSFDYNFEHFFPVESDDVAFYYQYREKFGADNDFLLIGFRNSRSVFDTAFLQKVDAVTGAIRELPLVKSVSGLTNLKTPVINDFGYTGIPLVDTKDASQLREDSARIVKDGLYTGRLLSADMKSTVLIVKHSDQPDKVSADSLLQQIDRIIARSDLEDVFITGKIRWEKTYLETTRSEMQLFISISLVFVVLFLWFTFRSFWGVMVPLLVVILSIVWTIGLMVATGKAIDLMVILVPCILFVVGMSDVIHITSQFHEKIVGGSDRLTAIRAAIREVGFATLLTCVATAFAFLTLRTTAVQPIRDFGTYTAFGVVAAYLLSITILPWMLLRVKNPSRLKIHTLNARWDRQLKSMLRWVFRNPTRIFLISLAILVIAGWGISQIRINNAVLDDLDESHPVKNELSFFDTHFSGVRGFELYVSSNGESLISWDNLQSLAKVNHFLYDSLHVGNLVSPVQVISGFRQAVHDGDPAWYGLPETRLEYDTLLNRIKPFLKTSAVRAYLDTSGKAARFSGQMKDKGSFAVGLKNDRLLAFLQTLPDRLNFRITGSSDLIDKSNNYMTSNMLEGLSMDLIVLMLIIFLIFRSWRMMLISVLPNLIPLLAVAGLMGFAGIEMKVTISIIFSIAFGIAIDDTLHLLSRLKVELDKGSTLPHALRVTYLSTGKAMILTALIISSGFAILMLSAFKSTFYIGLMISLTLLVALVAELFLMPILILYFYGRHYKKKAKHN
jgi:predicted RND superfamily exporter protein